VKVCISLLTTALDQLGGLNIRAGMVMRGLARAGIEVYAIQTRTAYEHSRNFYASTSRLPIQPILVDIPLKNGRWFFVQLLSLWRIPIGKWVPKGTDILDLWDPMVNLPERRAYSVIFSHNHFTPYVWQHFYACGIRSLPMFLEIPYMESMLRRLDRGVDAYITQTRQQREWLMARFDIPRDRVRAIPPGFDAGLITPLWRARAARSSEHVIAYSGRLHRWKGLFELVGAFARLAKEHNDWKLWLVGDGLGRDRLIELIRVKKLEDRVRFFGNRPQAEALQIISQADIFASPSYIESFSLSLLEAMALGLAPITTRSDGSSEMIGDEDTGIFIPRKDTKALYLALDRLIRDEDLRIRLGAKSRENAAPLTIEHMIRRTVNFYQNVLNS